MFYQQNQSGSQFDRDDSLSNSKVNHRDLIVQELLALTLKTQSNTGPLTKDEKDELVRGMLTLAQSLA